MDKIEALKTLRSALANLYPRGEDAGRIAVDAGLDIINLRVSDTAINNWRDILLEAEKQNKIRAVIEVAKEEYGTNKVLLQSSQAYFDAMSRCDSSSQQHDKPSTRNTSALTNPIKILFLAANPLDTQPLQLDEEIRSIDQALRKTEFRDRFKIQQHWAVRFNDLQELLLRHNPDIVHFSGHGSSSGEVILQDNTGNSHPVSVQALSTFFSIFKDNIRCVVLNACYSKEQADAIAQHIDAVVGMTTTIGDKAAINFATAFYQALGYGRSVKMAFDLGCSMINLANLEEQDTPQLLAQKKDATQIMFIAE